MLSLWLMNRIGRLFLFPMAGALLAAAAPTDPQTDTVRDVIVADARASVPAAIAFDRTTTTTKNSPLGRETNVTVDRWDGQKWVLVSVNGKPPGAGQLKNHRTVTTAQPVPGYHRLAIIFGAATIMGQDDQGRQVVKIPVLPAGSVRTDNADISRHLSGEAVITTTNGKPWVTELKLKARESFKLTSLIKVTEFNQNFDYRLGPDGRPRLAAQSALSKGQMFGFSGGETNQVTYTYR
jgi:hypothetical protein